MIAYLTEQLAPLGKISHKRMFGADCLFVHELMFAIIADDEIYIKKPHANDDDVRFSYVRQGKTVYLNYVLIDNTLIDEQDELIKTVKSLMN